MTYKVTGFIINKKDFREADRLFTIYTKEMGKIDAIAQGSRKLSSKLSGNLELLHHAVFTIAKGKQIDRIATVDVIETYEGIKSHLDALTVALYSLDLCDRAIKPGVPDAAVYDLLSDTLSACAGAKKNYSGVAHLFIIKLASALGYQPNAKESDIEKVAAGCLASLLERPAPSQVFFDFLTKRQPA